MLGELKKIEITSAISKKSEKSGVVNNRKSNTFNIRITGAIEYIFPDKTLVVNKGEMIFLPAGSSYTWRVISEEESTCLIILFGDDFTEKVPSVYSLEHFLHNDCFFNNFADLWNFGSTGEKYQCYSYLYELLSFICNQESFEYPDKKKFEIIEPAIKYLRNHIYDTSLKIDKLHNLCGVSHTYFRKIFIREMGMSPKDYVVEKRLSHAKVIIENGEMDTVKQLAYSVGYADPLYFSKAFKNQYGISPVQMNRL